MNKEYLAGLQRAAVEDVVPDGEKCLGDGRALDRGEARGQGQDIGAMDAHEFGIAAAGCQGHDLVPDAPARGARSKRRDHARHFESGKGRRILRCRISALALQHVGPIDAGGLDPDQHLAVAGPWHSHGLGLEHLRVPRLRDHDPGHLRRKIRNRMLGHGHCLHSGPLRRGL
jgi:hypothetical protein